MKTNEAKENMCMKGREYKKILGLKKAKYDQDIADKLEQVKLSESKKFWKLIMPKERKKGGSRKVVSAEALHKHFENLNKKPADHESQGIKLEVNLEDDNEINRPISAEEIAKVISGLKNNKAAGMDGILNEYIKATSNVLMSKYVKLFNDILDTGNIPSDWALGFIVPIYKNKGEKDDPNNYRGITISRISTISRTSRFYERF